MPVVQDDVLKVVWTARQTSPNTIAQNVFFLRVDDVTDGDFVNVWADINAWLVAMYNNVAAQFTTGYLHTDTRITDETQKVFVGDGVEGPAFAGTDAGECSPAMNACEVLARSRALGHIGRKYVGPLAESAMNDGDLTVGAHANFVLFVNAWDAVFIGATTNNTYQPGTAKFNQGGGLAGFTAFADDLQKVVVGIRTQRRRRPTVGLS